MTNLITKTNSTVTIHYSGIHNKVNRAKINKALQRANLDIEVVRDEMESQWFVVYKDQYTYFKSSMPSITINL